jgi:hypothetical protein
MCAIAVSPTLGLIRIYPLSITNHADACLWAKVELQLRVADTDNRDESYRLIDYEVVGTIKNREAKRELLEACVLDSGDIDPITFQNSRRKSIAVVSSFGSVGVSMVAREPGGEVAAGTDEDGFAMTQSEFPFKPYIEWTSRQGSSHKTHLVGQEVYMGMLNNPATPLRIFENMHVCDRDYQHWIVLGNMKDRRNVWVAAHLHRQKKIAQLPMLGNSWINDGTPNGWPYETKEAMSVRFAETHPLLNSII